MFSNKCRPSLVSGGLPAKKSRLIFNGTDPIFKNDQKRHLTQYGDYWEDNATSCLDICPPV
jgi:hypothetical protein